MAYSAAETVERLHSKRLAKSKSHLCGVDHIGGYLVVQSRRMSTFYLESRCASELLTDHCIGACAARRSAIFTFRQGRCASRKTMRLTVPLRRYVTKDQAETSVLFELIAARYERRSMLITALMRRVHLPDVRGMRGDNQDESARHCGSRRDPAAPPRDQPQHPAHAGTAHAGLARIVAASD
jgi:hypothetical protein